MNMKKIFLALTAVLGLAFTTSAQDYGFQKGNFLVEGSLQVTSQNNSDVKQKESSFGVQPKVGYFLSDKFALGVDFLIGTSRRNSDSLSSDWRRQKGSEFAVGVFGRYYFLEVGSRFKTYTTVGGKYQQSRMTAYDNPDFNDIEVGVNAFLASAGIGANFFLTEDIAINYVFSDVLSYTTQKQDVPNAKSASHFGMNLNVFNNFFETSRFGLTFKF